MSLDGLKTGFVAFLNKDGEIAGNGFLTHGALVVTCAHVVTAVLTGNKNTKTDAPEDYLNIQFRDAKGRPEYKAKVVEGGWFPETEELLDECQDGLCDVAILRLEEEPPKDAVEIAPAICAVQDQPVRLRPYIPGNGARPINGDLGGANEFGKLIFKAKTDFHQFIEPGCSGAPAFTSNGEQAVGIVDTRDRSVKEALLTPATALWKALTHIKPDILRDILRSQDLGQAEIDALREKYSGRESKLANLLLAILRQDIPADRLDEALSLAEERVTGLLENVEKIPNDISEAVRDKKIAAKTALKEHDLDLAEKLFAEIEQERKEALGRAIGENAEATADLARVAMAGLDHVKAAALFRKAADTPGLSSDLRWQYLLAQAGAAYEHGEYFPEPQPLQQAIEIYRDECLPISPTPLDQAGVCNNLGNALRKLGERESGTERLEQAVDAYEKALEEFTQERTPLEWAMSWNNLGTALQSLGDRESGTERLEQAVVAYKKALKEYTQERAPLDWATTCNNLGNALQALGERESGTGRLEQAVDAYKKALKEYTQDRAPLKWAMTWNNLGNALQTLGARESSTERLEQAVDAYEKALEEYTQERAPLKWATSWNNLGNTLLLLGEREGGTERLEQAVDAYKKALEERTQERAPLDWAISFGAQGAAKMVLAACRGDKAMATLALEQISAALMVAQEGGHAPLAAFLEGWQAKAQELIKRMKK